MANSKRHTSIDGLMELYSIFKDIVPYLAFLCRNVYLKKQPKIFFTYPCLRHVLS